LEAGQPLAHQPRPRVCADKSERDRLLRPALRQTTGALGWGDAGWWSRLAQPEHQSWRATTRPLRVPERTAPTAERDPQALACAGLLVRQHPPPEQRVWRCVEGRPVRAVTIDGLAWCPERWAAPGGTARRLSWDHAAGPNSPAVRPWRRRHQQPGKRTGPGGRLVSCGRPATSPGRKPIAPRGVHGQRAVSEPDRWRPAMTWDSRMCPDDGGAREPQVLRPTKVA
jgi:hypothetical protein